MTEDSPGREYAGDRLSELVKHEHQCMQRLMDDIQGNTNPADLRTLLEEFRACLVGHYKLDEAEDGLFDSIQKAAPRFASQIARMKAEHQDFVAAVDALLERFPDASSKAELQKSIVDLVARKRQDDSEESELLFESIERDLGGLG